MGCVSEVAVAGFLSFGGSSSVAETARVDHIAMAGAAAAAAAAPAGQDA
jgi:hypothetical protein